MSTKSNYQTGYIQVVPTRTYQCAFEFLGKTLFAESVEGPSAFKDGFWINGELKYSHGDDVKYWIPPSKIQHITKPDIML